MRLARHLKPGSGGNRKSPSTYDPRIDAAIIAVYDALARRDRKNNRPSAQSAVTRLP